MSLHMIDTGSGEDWFLIKIERGGTLYGHAVGTLSEVTDRIADQELASLNGEESDVIDVWDLGLFNPVPVKVEFKRHAQIGFMEVVFTWRQPVNDGRKITHINRRESGYFRLSEA